MRRRIGNLCAVGSSLLAFVLAPSWALPQFVSGSDGSDGAFNPTSNSTIDLSLASIAAWNTPSPVAGKGVYDPDNWAVVFKYTTITIPAGVTVTFTNHGSRAPVVWLTQGDVTINGSVNLDGGAGHLSSESRRLSEPGPGGFRGALGGIGAQPSAMIVPSAGMGPGGSDIATAAGGCPHGFGGSHTGPGTPFYSLFCQDGDALAIGAVYGNSSAQPLLGGSGGSGGWGTSAADGCGGGAGGGAIIMASSTRIFIDSLSMRAISARGGNTPTTGTGSGRGGPGSGGTVRLMANDISGDATDLSARGGAAENGYYDPYGGDGEIKIEAYTNRLGGQSTPPYTAAIPGPVFPSEQAPSLRAAGVGDQPVPSDPLAALTGPNAADVVLHGAVPAMVSIEGRGIPTGTTVRVRIVPVSGGPEIEVDSTPLVDVGGELLTAAAQVAFPRGLSVVQLRAGFSPAQAFAGDEAISREFSVLLTAQPDVDDDGDVDMDDFAILEACASGPGLLQNGTDCGTCDFDGDEDVDQSDFALFQRCLSGTSVPANPGCVD